MCVKCSKELHLYTNAVDTISIITKIPDLSNEQMSNMEEIVNTAGSFRNAKLKLIKTVTWRVAALLTIILTGSILFISKELNLHMDIFSRAQVSAIPELWSAPFGDLTYLTPAQRPAANDNAVFVLQSKDDSIRIVALDAKSGKHIWTGKRNCFGYLLPDQEKLYSVCSNQTSQPALTALDSRTSEELWQFSSEKIANPQNITAPVFCGGKIYWEVEGSLHCISSVNGKQLWKHAIPTGGKCALSVLDDKSIIVVTQNKISGFDSTGRETIRPVDLAQDLSSLYTPILVSQGMDLFICHHRSIGGSVVFSCDMANGMLRWKKNMPPTFDIALSNGLLLVRSQSIHALETRTGNERWTIDAGGCSPIVNAKSLCFVISSGDSGKLLRLDTHRGTIIDERSVGGSCAGLVLNNGCGYLSDNKGTIRAFNFLNFKRV
jgi:outer membrane protein assembly factor BamB